jgi:hypothetical protein
MEENGLPQNYRYKVDAAHKAAAPNNARGA